MSLAAGTKLGPYEILALIGAGGMGEVYRARDTKLKRDVALKVLPEVFATDPERMARFQREAEVLASLNHPNIAHIYGVEDRALVMELVEGESPKGPMPFHDAWKVMAQVAEGLEYAHERRIVHRDLKPSNLKLTPEGRVKILDFGLAKALSTTPVRAEAAVADSPTLTMGATQAGVVLGTATYMAPEQIKGKEADRRADIWAFGIVLYELLTGERPFKGKDTTEIMASAVMGEPLLDQAPTRVKRLLTACLQKQPEDRLGWIGDAPILLDVEAAPVPALPEPTRSGFARTAWIAAGIFATIAGVLAFLHFRESPPPQPELVRFQVALPESLTLAPYLFQVSPDGRKLAFVGISSGVPRVWIKTLESLEMHPLVGTEGVTGSPFWSFDSRSLGFPVSNQLKTLDVSGSPPQAVPDVGAVVGGFWTRDGQIVVGAGVREGLRPGLMRVPASGGPASTVTLIDASRGENRHLFPVLLPDGRHFIYLRYSGVPENSGIYVGSLDSKPQEQSLRRILATQFVAQYVPSVDPNHGFLLFFRDGTVLAQPLDTRRLELTGDPVPIADHVGSYINAGLFAASANGVLVYSSGGPEQLQLKWFDRQGKPGATLGEPVYYRDVSISPDGSKVAVSQSGLNVNLWVVDSTRGVSTRFTADSVPDLFPVWSPDGSWIAFSSLRAGRPGLYRKLSSSVAGEQLLFESYEPKIVTDWSRDGRYILFGMRSSKTQYDIWALPVEGDRKPFPLVTTQFDEQQGCFSPDSHWIAYSSDASGRREIYVQPFAAPSSAESTAVGAVRVSASGGSRPRWRRDGKELFYIAGDNKMIAVPMNGGPSGPASALFETPAGYSDWDVSADGKKFLFAVPIASNSRTPFTVVLNWQAGLKK